MTTSKFISLPFSVKLNKLLLEAQYIGSAKIDHTVCVLYLFEKEYFEIIYTDDMNKIISIDIVKPKHLCYFCDFDLKNLL